MNSIDVPMDGSPYFSWGRDALLTTIAPTAKVPTKKTNAETVGTSVGVVALLSAALLLVGHEPGCAEGP